MRGDACDGKKNDANQRLRVEGVLTSINETEMEMAGSLTDGVMTARVCRDYKNNIHRSKNNLFGGKV